MVVLLLQVPLKGRLLAAGELALRTGYGTFIGVLPQVDLEVV